MGSLAQEIDKSYSQFEDKMSYPEFQELCFQIHKRHAKQYLNLLFGRQNKTHDVINRYAQHIIFHVNQEIEKIESGMMI